MACPNTVRRLLITMMTTLGLTAAASPARAQEPGIFAGLPYEETFIREKIAEYSIRRDSTEASWDIPVNLTYQLLFKELLADASLLAKIGAADAALIRALPAPWDHSFLVKDQAELATLCEEAASADTALEVVDLAVRFDNSRLRKENELDAFYGNALNQLTAATRSLVQQRLLEFSASKHIAYATFDMGGFAEALPEAAQAMLLNGCGNFSAQLRSYAPQTVTLGDLVAQAVQGPE